MGGRVIVFGDVEVSLFFDCIDVDDFGLFMFLFELNKEFSDEEWVFLCWWIDEGVKFS